MAHDLHGISQDAEDLVIESEVTSRNAYDRKYCRPTVPGVDSGVTIGIGYDLGQSSKAQIKADWSGKVDDDTLARLISCAGLKGERARAQRAQIADVRISWDAALSVFSNRDIPRYLEMCRAHLPGFDNLHADCKGAIWSLVFNRGPSFDNKGPRYAEMRAIKECMRSGDLAGIPAQFRAMKRIWKDDPQAKGLLIRREKEATLFERGLAKGHLDDHALVQHRPAPHDADQVAKVQKLLNAWRPGCTGAVDGTLGKRTKGAILAFRHDHDLPLTPTIDDDLMTALTAAEPDTVSDHRANATVEDVREQGSKTIAVTDAAKNWAGKMVGSGGVLSGMGGIAAITAKLDAIKGLKDSFLGLGIPSEALMVGGCILVGLVGIAVAGCVVWVVADKVEKVRLADYRSGKNA